MPSFHIIEPLLRDLYGSGEPIKIAGRSYTVHRMSYGDYFLQPHGWEGGEKDGFAPGTLWLTLAPKGHPHGAGYVLDYARNDGEGSCSFDHDHAANPSDCLVHD